MAGDWIKFELSTLDKPEVMRMGRILGLSREAVCGHLIRFWGWLGNNSVDGVVDAVVDGDVDVMMSLPGFSTALQEVGWANFDVAKRRLSVPHFDNHNGESSKKRALKTRRQQNWRSQSVDAPPSTKASTREEKRRDNPIVPNERFETFWKAYPKRKAKPKAEKAFLKLNPDEQLLAVILAAVSKARTQTEWQREGGKFIPYPASYLNGKRWLDEDAAPALRRVAI